MSKFSFDVLQRSVFPYVKSSDPDVLLGAGFGEDVALTRVGDDILASHVDPIVGAIGHIGSLAVQVACNDLAVSGVPPRWILALVLVPRQEDEETLSRIMQDINQVAKELNISVIGGHTGYSAGLSRPLVAVTALGTLSGRKPVLTGGAKPGDHILVTKGIALEGTAILAEDFADVALDLDLTDGDLQEGKGLGSLINVIPEALALADHGATAMHDVTRGGLLETLLEMAHLSQAGFEVTVSRIPIHPVVSRFAQAFAFDPLRMISSGTIAAAVPADTVEQICEALHRLDVPVADVGRVIPGNGVTLIRDEGLEQVTELHCEDDELARMWSLYPRD